MIATADMIFTYMGTQTSSATSEDVALVNLLTPVATSMIKDEVGHEIELATFKEYHPDSMVAPVEDELVDGYEVIGGRVVPRGPRGQKARAIIQLRNIPVREIVSVYEAPAAWDQYPPEWPGGTQLTEGQHFRVDYDNENNPGISSTYTRLSWTGHLIRRVGIWSPIGRCVKITYKAGFTDAELSGRHSVYRLALIQTVAFWVKEARLLSIAGGNSGILIGKTIDGYARTWAAPQQMLNSMGIQTSLPPGVLKMLEKRKNLSNIF